MSDILEEAKKALGYYEPNDPEFPVKLVTNLIAEVEKLRVWGNEHKDGYVEIKAQLQDELEKIDSLTKERSQLLFDRQELRCLRDDLKAKLAESEKKIESLTKERDNYQSLAMTGAATHFKNSLDIEKRITGKLKAENASKQQLLDIEISRVSECNKEIKELKAKLAESADKETKDGLLMIISGLHKELAEKEKKVEELEDLIDSYKGEGIYGA